MKILVVDDDKMIVKAIAHELEAVGYEVSIADNAVEALRVFEKVKPDLVITDVMMPGMSGLSLVSLLREFYSHHIPVIIISSLRKATLAHPVLHLKANDCILKPINFNLLLQRVNNWLK